VPICEALPQRLFFALLPRKNEAMNAIDRFSQPPSPSGSGRKSEIQSVIEPLPEELVAAFSQELETALAVLEERFSEFTTHSSLVRSLDRLPR
jgi:hypothetical protein